MALHQDVLLQDRNTKQWYIYKGQGGLNQTKWLIIYVVETDMGTYLGGIKFIKAVKSAAVYMVESANEEQHSKSLLSQGLPQARSSKAVKRTVVNLTQPRCLGHKLSRAEGIGGQTGTRHLEEVKTSIYRPPGTCQVLQIWVAMLFRPGQNPK